MLHVRIPFAPEQFQPAANRIDRELGGIVVDANTYATGVGRDVVHAIRDGFSKFLVDEIVHVDVDRTTFRAIVAAAVLERAYQFLFLRIDGNHRLTSRLRGDSCRVDVLELRVAVRMIAAIQGLAVYLPPVVQLRQQFRDAALRDLMSQCLQRLSQFRVTFRHPEQNPLRVAHRHRLHNPPEIFQQGRILLRQRGLAATGAPHHTGQGLGIGQILQPASDGAVGDTGRSGHRRDPAMAGRLGLRRHEKAAGALVKPAAYQREPCPNH